MRHASASAATDLTATFVANAECVLVPSEVFIGRAGRHAGDDLTWKSQPGISIPAPKREHYRPGSSHPRFLSSLDLGEAYWEREGDGNYSLQVSASAGGMRGHAVFELCLEPVGDDYFYRFDDGSDGESPRDAPI